MLPTISTPDIDRGAFPTPVNLGPGAPELLLATTACPLCHTAPDGVQAQSAWQCQTCGQRWTPLRLATVDAYAIWAKARESSAPSV